MPTNGSQETPYVYQITVTRSTIIIMIISLGLGLTMHTRPETYATRVLPGDKLAAAAQDTRDRMLYTMTHDQSYAIHRQFY